MAHHHKLDCLVKRLDCFVVVEVKVTEKVHNYSDCSSDDISSTAQPFVTELGMWCIIMGLAGRLVFCLQVQGHSGGSYNQGSWKTPFCTYSCTRTSNPCFRLSACAWNLPFKIHSISKEWEYFLTICVELIVIEVNNLMWTMQCNTLSQLQWCRQRGHVLCHD